MTRRHGDDAPAAPDDRDARERLFWALAKPLLDEPPVTRSTMMGFPCLRFEGRFFASIDRESKDLVVKLFEQFVRNGARVGRATIRNRDATRWFTSQRRSRRGSRRRAPRR